MPVRSAARSAADTGMRRATSGARAVAGSGLRGAGPDALEDEIAMQANIVKLAVNGGPKVRTKP